MESNGTAPKHGECLVTHRFTTLSIISTSLQAHCSQCFPCIGNIQYTRKLVWIFVFHEIILLKENERFEDFIFALFFVYVSCMWNGV